MYINASSILTLQIVIKVSLAIVSLRCLNADRISVDSHRKMGSAGIFTYAVNKNAIPHVHQFKYLGLYISNDLRRDNHITFAINKTVTKF